MKQTDESDRDPERAPAPDLDAYRADAREAGALAGAATPDWTQAFHIDEPRALVSANDMTLSLLALDRDGMAIFDRAEDAAFASAARLGWPRDAGRVVELATRNEALQSALTAALDGWDQAHFPAPVRKADAATIARLRSIVANRNERSIP